MCNSHCLCFKLPAIATAGSAGIRLGERECHDVLLLAVLGETELSVQISTYKKRNFLKLGYFLFKNKVFFGEYKREFVANMAAIQLLLPKFDFKILNCIQLKIYA